MKTLLTTLEFHRNLLVAGSTTTLARRRILKEGNTYNEKHKNFQSKHNIRGIILRHSSCANLQQLPMESSATDRKF